jgi:alkyldihydroxyacetonephosphate synthase
MVPAVDVDRLRRALVPIVGERRLSMRDADLATYARDMWPRLLLAVRDGSPLPHRPHAVVWPESVREVAAIVRVARDQGVPIVPYGGGSGVCGGAVPLHGGITIDTKRMDALESVDPDEMVCDVQAGMNGQRFENELGRRGYTVGNFPSSIYCSTVGGWLACRAAGQMSTKYGKIEDRVVGLTCVTGRGEVLETDGMRRAQSGPDLTQLIVGSEGTLAVITSARLRLAPVPELRILRGFEIATVAEGVDAIRRVLQRGLRPAVVRLYDEVDTFLNHAVSLGGQPVDDPEGFAPPAPAPGGGALPRLPGKADAASAGLAARLGKVGRALKHDLVAGALGRPRLLNSVAGALAERVARKGCRLIIGLEGSRIRTEIEAGLVFDELGRAGARDLGEEPGRAWFEHRYAVSYKMSPLFREGAFVDTMEVAATWDRLGDLYREVRAALSRHALVMAHFSHAYPEGCSIYFTFVTQRHGRAAEEAAYDALWRDALAATSRVGGTISHHHGVGVLKAGAMTAEHREAMTVLRALKRALDPDGVMNPGKLGLGAR